MERVYNFPVQDYHANALDEALKRVAGSRVPAGAIEALARSAPTVAVRLHQAVLAEVPEFSRSRNPDLLPEMAQHGHDNVHEILRLLRGGVPAGLDFVRTHARRRAEQHFPMEATLHAYRSGHKVLSRWLRESTLSAAMPASDVQPATSAIADFAMEYADAISTTFATTYAAHALLLAEVAGDQRSELLRILLGGHDEADLRAARILREAGFLNERQLFCVALARSVDPTEMLNASRARRMADAIDGIVADMGIRRVIDVHNNRVTMVCSAVSRESGWTAPRSSLARQLRAELARVGNAALIGVSNDVPATAHIPTALREAEAALELATVAERVVQFAEIPLRRLLLHFAAPEFRRVLPAWTGQFRDADDRAEGALVATLRAYADTDMNILKAAQTLGVHPNTIYARLQRIAGISGLRATSFNALNDLLAVSDCMRHGLLGDPKPAG